MIVVAGRIQVDPKKRESASTALIEMMQATRKEPACISYTFSHEIDDPSGLRIFEEWESAEALQVHFGTPHMTAFQAKFPDYGVVDVKVQRYEVSSVGPVR